MSMQQTVSVRPSDASQGGGLLDDADVTIKQLRYVVRDRTNPRTQATLDTRLYIEAVLVDDEGREHTEYYSIGDTSKFVPSPDGRRALAVVEGARFVQSSKGIRLIASLVNAGFPEDKIADDLSVFDGTYGHVNRTTLPRIAGQEKDATILEFTKIHRLPWEKKSGSAATKSKPAAATPAAKTEQAAPEHVREKAIATLFEVLAQNGGSIPRQKVAPAAFKLLATDPDRNDVVALVFTEQFLRSVDGISFDGQTISLTE
jgi:hypothetical protein